jgi:hypothetical protein
VETPEGVPCPVSAMRPNGVHIFGSCLSSVPVYQRPFGLDPRAGAEKQGRSVAVHEALGLLQCFHETSLQGSRRQLYAPQERLPDIVKHTSNKVAPPWPKGANTSVGTPPWDDSAWCSHPDSSTGHVKAVKLGNIHEGAPCEATPKTRLRWEIA